jgi:gliding motility-associated lipoprotein GldH
MTNFILMNRIILLSFFALSLIACQPENRVFLEHQELSPNLEWLKKDVPVFNVPIADSSGLYDMSLAFRFANGYQYQVLLVKMTETSPSGKQQVTEHELKVREDNGEYIGEAGLDIWDSEHLIAQGRTFEEAGTYSFTIEHNMPVEVLNYAMEIGVIVDKSVK